MFDSPAVLSAKTCCVSSSQLGGVALRAELQPGLVGLGLEGEKGGMDGVRRDWRRIKRETVRNEIYTVR